MLSVCHRAGKAECLARIRYGGEWGAGACCAMRGYSGGSGNLASSICIKSFRPMLLSEI